MTKFHTFLVLLMAASTLSGCTIAGDPADSTKEIIDLLLADDYDGVYDAASYEFQSATPEDQFTAYATFLRTTCGKLEGSRLVSRQRIDAIGVDKTEFVYNAKFSAYEDSIPLNLTFIQDELFMLYLDPPKWIEPKPAKGITADFFSAFKSGKHGQVYDLLHEDIQDEASREEMVEVMDNIAEKAKADQFRYYYTIIDFNVDFSTIIQFQYVVEKVGKMKLNYTVEDGEYILIGVFFDKDLYIRYPED